MQENNSATGLNQLLKILAEKQIDFIVIGGFAGVLYGSSLVTRDLDICMVLAPKSIDRLREILKPYSPVHRMTPQRLSFATEPRSLEGVNDLYLETDLGILDILSSVKGLPGYEILKQRATAFTLFGTQVWTLSLSDLIEAKKQMGRPKDLITVSELERIQKDQEN